jgi:excisionase family DNA binding protein
MNHKALSTYQAAALCGVHHTTIINWVNDRKLKAYRTPGGHRRIKREDLVNFVDRYQIPIPDGTLSAKRLLVVDDDKEALDELSDVLDGHGFIIDCASDGFEAGRKIYKTKPDLILLDFRMPGMDGFDVCKVLRNDDDTSEIPIIAVTALQSPEDRHRIMRAGVIDYISKPINIPHLLKSVKRLLKIEEQLTA